MILDIIAGESKESLDIIHDTFHWMGHQLGLDKYKKLVYIDLTFSKDLFKKTGAESSILWFDLYRPRDFDLEIDAGLTGEDLKRCIVHEMIHLADAASGRWQQTYDSMIMKWNGKPYNLNETLYGSRPWEIKAFQLEDYYLLTFNERMKNEKDEVAALGC